MESAFSRVQEVRAYLKAQQNEMVAFLGRLVEMESPSSRPETQGPVQALLTDVLEDLAFQVDFVPGGGHLYARPKARRRGAPYQLLLGHSDTVWPVGTLDTMPFVVEGNEVRGPGSYDMKAGLVQIAFALRALRACNLDPEVTPVVFINADEEVGSPTSTPYIRRLARCADRAYVLEPALGRAGGLKTARKGGGRFTVFIEGKAAHAGLNPEAGRSAIIELAHVIQKLHALNDLARGVSVNVGMIDGGLQPNVVAPTSKAVVDVRVATQADAEAVEAAIRNLQPTTPGTALRVEGGFVKAPMERTPRNRALWSVAQQAGQALGLDLAEGFAGGGSDGNTTSLFTATLDGLGAVGDGAHASHEFLYRDRLVERCALLTLLIALPSLRNGTSLT